MPSEPSAIEVPRQRTRIVFTGGQEKILPIQPSEFRRTLGQAGAQGALFITIPNIAGTVDISIPNICYFESVLQGD